jgi:hypothetical protein
MRMMTVLLVLATAQALPAQQTDEAPPWAGLVVTAAVEHADRVYGQVEGLTLCVVTGEEWLGIGPGEMAPLSDGGREEVAAALRAAGHEASAACDTPLDEDDAGRRYEADGAPAVYLIVSDVDDAPGGTWEVHVGSKWGPRNGGGATCRWRTDDEGAWQVEVCSMRWSA